MILKVVSIPMIYLSHSHIDYETTHGGNVGHCFFVIRCSQMFTIVTSDQKSEVPLPILNNIWISTLVHMQIGGHNYINPIRVEDNRFYICSESA